MLTCYRFFSSSLGSKLLIALTGLSMIGFLVVHLVGNLLFFLGPGVFNEYSHRLISNPLIIPAELGLVAILLVHMYNTVTGWLENQSARPVAYVAPAWVGAPSRKSWASTTMIVTGILVFVFLVSHVKMLKYGPWYTLGEGGVRDLYRLESEIFHAPGYLAFYLVGLVIIGFHLWHGFSSAFESLGINHPRITSGLLILGKIVAVIIAGGFIAIALGIALGGKP